MKTKFEENKMIFVYECFYVDIYFILYIKLKSNTSSDFSFVRDSLHRENCNALGIY